MAKKKKKRPVQQNNLPKSKPMAKKEVLDLVSYMTLAVTNGINFEEYMSPSQVDRMMEKVQETFIHEANMKDYIEQNIKILARKLD